jgi:hypothetical protein
MAPRPSVPLREIVYTLSPYNQEVVMQGVAKLPGKVAKFFKNVRGLLTRARSRNARHAGRRVLAAAALTPLLCCSSAELVGPCHLERRAVWPHPVSVVVHSLHCLPRGRRPRNRTGCKQRRPTPDPRRAPC